MKTPAPEATRQKAPGCVATCNSGGAGKWRDDFARWFDQAKAVRIIADKDEPGRKHAAAVAANLRSKAASVKVLELPDMAGQTVKDAADFFEAGGTAEQLRQFAEAAPEFQPPAPAPGSTPPPTGAASRCASGGAEAGT